MFFYPNDAATQALMTDTATFLGMLSAPGRGEGGIVGERGETQAHTGTHTGTHTQAHTHTRINPLKLYPLHPKIRVQRPTPRT